MDDKQKELNADMPTQKSIRNLERQLRFSIMIDSDSETALTQKGHCLQRVAQRMGIELGDILIQAGH